MMQNGNPLDQDPCPPLIAVSTNGSCPRPPSAVGSQSLPSTNLGLRLAPGRWLSFLSEPSPELLLLLVLPYLSRVLKPAESRYSKIEQACLALVFLCGV